MYVCVLVLLAQYDACTGLHVGVLVLVCHAVCRQVRPSVCLCARVCLYEGGVRSVLKRGFCYQSQASRENRRNGEEPSTRRRLKH